MKPFVISLGIHVTACHSRQTSRYFMATWALLRVFLGERGIAMAKLPTALTSFLNCMSMVACFILACYFHLYMVKLEWTWAPFV